ncbi:MAG: transporter permease, partial [Subtercola sp.]|nr:transporter permease [Subtercola sp.]
MATITSDRRAGRNQPPASRTDNPGVKFVPRKKKSKRTTADWLLLAGAIVVGVAIAVPFYLILINSFKSPADYASGGPLQWPTALNFDGIVKFWNRVDFPQKLWNSFFISALVAIFAVVISVLNAYAIGIGRVRGRTWIVVLFLLANVLPQEALLYPLYFMFK